MIIKKYQAQTEEEAILQARDDLGKDAIVMNIKKIKPKGIYKLFKKPLVEITAAVDDAKTYSSLGARNPRNVNEAEAMDRENKRYDEVSSVEEKSAIEEKLDNLQDMLKKQMQSTTIKVAEPVVESKEVEETEEKESKQPEKNDKKTQCLNLIKEKMMDNDVAGEYVEQILGEVDKTIKSDASVDNILTTIYQKIATFM